MNPSNHGLGAWYEEKKSPFGLAMQADTSTTVRRPSPSITEFDAILQELRELHLRKQADYGSKEDPYQNVVNSEAWGVAPWVGASVRISDKEKRLQEFAKGNRLANESAEDSMIDNCVYNIIRLILWRRSRASRR